MADTEYAKGGAKLGRTRDFLKEPDRFTGATFKERSQGVKTDETWGKGMDHADSVPEPKGKCLKPIMPRQ